MRLVINFAKRDAMAYVAHLDFQRLWQRLLRAAGVDVQLTQGFNPHPKIRFALPLATGYQGRSELLEVDVAPTTDPATMAAAINRLAPPGLEVLAVTPVPDQFPKLTALVDVLEYEVIGIQGTGHPQQLLAQKGLLDTGTKQIDLNQFVVASQLQGDRLHLLLRVKNQATVRPEQVARHWYGPVSPAQVVRCRILVDKARAPQPVPSGLGVL